MSLAVRGQRLPIFSASLDRCIFYQLTSFFCHHYQFTNWEQLFKMPPKIQNPPRQPAKSALQGDPQNQELARLPGYCRDCRWTSSGIWPRGRRRTHGANKTGVCSKCVCHVLYGGAFCWGDFPKLWMSIWFPFMYTRNKKGAVKNRHPANLEQN